MFNGSTIIREQKQTAIREGQQREQCLQVDKQVRKEMY